MATPKKSEYSGPMKENESKTSPSNQESFRSGSTFPTTRMNIKSKNLEFLSGTYKRDTKNNTTLT